MGRFARSWSLTKKSWSVVMADKKLLVLVVVSAVCGLAVTAIFLVPTALLAFGTDTSAASQASDQQQIPWIVYPVLFVMYVALAFTATFFNAALLKIADARLAGGSAGIGTGLRFASSHTGALFGWATINATVGIVLRALSDRDNAITDFVINLVGAAWSLVTYFVVPVLVFENIGPVSAVKRSASLFRERWGEQFIGTGGIGLVTSLVAVVGILVAVAGGVLAAVVNPAVGIPILAVGGLWFLVVLLVSSALRQIYNVALYRFAVGADDATGATTMGPFTAAELEHAFVPKSQRVRTG